MISVIGSGGKSTALRYVSLDLKRRGYCVVCFTTTKMGLEQFSFADRHFESFQALAAFVATSDPVNECISVYVAHEKRVQTPFNPLNDCIQILESLLRNPHLRMVYEADGAKMLPLKSHAGDPVFLPFRQEILCIIGLSGLGKKLKDVCYRSEQFCAAHGVSGEAIVDISLLKLFAQDYTGQFSSWDGQWRNSHIGEVILCSEELAEIKKQSKTTLVFNQTDLVSSDILEELRREFNGAIFGAPNIFTQ